MLNYQREDVESILHLLTPAEARELDWLLSMGTPSLIEFTLQVWSILEPDTLFKPNWHLSFIAEHLEAISAGQLTKLIVNVPPGGMKSLLTSVIWPIWDWLENPGRRFVTASYAQTLATRDSVKSRRIIQSLWFQTLFGHIFQLTSDQNQKTRYENDKTGFRLATSVGGATGERAHIRILDDPHNIDDIDSDLVREGVIDWLRYTWSQRAADPSNPYEVLIMQRLHEKDATGYYLELGGYEHIVIPMEFESDRKCFTKIGSDPRTEEGELYFPDRFPAVWVEQEKRNLGPYGTACQFQQNPAPRGGGIFKKKWLKFWKYAGVEVTPILTKDEAGNIVECQVVDLPNDLTMLSSWDMSFKDTKSSSYVAGQIWGWSWADRYLLDQYREQADFVKTVKAFLDMTVKWPAARAKFIEDKANGPAVISLLRSKISGLIPIEPHGDKVSRAAAVSIDFASGNVYFPHPDIFPWVKPFVERLVLFPNVKEKDEIDSLSQALLILSTRGKQRVMGADDYLKILGIDGNSH